MMSHYCSVMVRLLLVLGFGSREFSHSLRTAFAPSCAFSPPPRSRFHPSPYQWDTDEVNTFNSMAIPPPPPPPASLWRKCWMAGSNFLIHLSGGWLTGSVLAELMSRLLSSMHYSSSKHYFGDIYAQSHVKELNRSSQFCGCRSHTLLNRWNSKNSDEWAFCTNVP